MKKEMIAYTNKELCSQCKGECCKESGCMYMPSDFKKMKYSKLKNELLKGDISIDAFPVTGFYKDAWTLILFLRARNENCEIVDLFTNGGPCKMLKENGCFYDEKDRPSCGLSVKPIKIGGPCPKMFDENYFTSEWLKHQNVLELLLKDFTKQELFDYVVNIVQEKAAILDEKIKNNEKLTASETTNFERFRNIISNKPFYTSSELMRSGGISLLKQQK